MESNWLKMIKATRMDTETETDYPANMGLMWTGEDENTLLQELNKNTPVEIIAQILKRTIGGILGKQKSIAYNMYIRKMCIEDIIIKTKLDKEQLMDMITKQQNKTRTFKNEIFEIKDEIKELKNTIKDEIKELKNTIKELVEMTNAVYEFENIA